MVQRPVLAVVAPAEGGDLGDRTLLGPVDHGDAVGVQEVAGVGEAVGGVEGEGRGDPSAALLADLVLAERPDVVVIASSDSDFAPLVHRLREKGCVVRGIGQLGKTGDETQDVYDDFTVLEHRKSAASQAAADKPKRAPRKTAAGQIVASDPT